VVDGMDILLAGMVLAPRRRIHQRDSYLTG